MSDLSRAVVRLQKVDIFQLPHLSSIHGIKAASVETEPRKTQVSTEPRSEGDFYICTTSEIALF